MTKILTEKQTLSGYTLKWLAVASMVIDHFASLIMDGVLAPYRTNGYIFFTADMPFLVRNAYSIKYVCEAIGSVAFPLFCFLMVEGFLHTRSPLKYGLRMGLFALVSEIPYDLSHYHIWFQPRLQNVLFTLCVGIFTLLLIRFLEEKLQGRGLVRWTLVAAAALAGMAAAFLLRSEYVFLGVLAAVLFYLLRRNRFLRLIGLAPLLIASPWVLLALPPILFYSGARGKGSKYFFYIFYPTHFLLLGAIANLLAGRSIG